MAPSAIDTDGGGPAPRLCNIVTPVGMCGYGFEDYQTINALEELIQDPSPTAIILDSGSTDSGPSKLALGTMTCPRDSYVRDLNKLLGYVHKYKVPLITTSAGGDGTNQHVEEYLQIIQELSERPENR